MDYRQVKKKKEEGSSCKHCSFERDEIFTLKKYSKLEKDDECRLFRFRQNDKCYCFCIAQIYKWIYGSLDLDAEIKTNKNPSNNTPLAQLTLTRLKNEYADYYHSMNKGLTITDKERSMFLEGIDSFVIAFEQHLPKGITKRELVNMYLEDMRELTDEKEFERQLIIAKVVVSEMGW